jgi:DNA-binding XRE family transcriptional regulator
MTLSPTQVRMARSGLQWTQAELAHVSHVPVGTIKNIEAGRAKASEQMLRAMMAAFEAVGVTFASGGTVTVPEAAAARPSATKAAVERRRTSATFRTRIQFSLIAAANKGMP